MKTRDSKFEFLRIIAMMMIVLTHLSSHGVMKVASQDALILWQGVHL